MICRLLGLVFAHEVTHESLLVTAAIALVAVAVRALCASGAAWASHRASRAAKRRLRPLIFFSSMMFAPPCIPISLIFLR